METGPQGKYMFYSSSIWGNNFHIPFCLYHALHFAKIFPPAQVYVSSLKCVEDMHMSHVLIILFLIKLKKKKRKCLPILSRAYFLESTIELIFPFFPCLTFHLLLSP